jgi:hypothetical protein
MTGLVKQFGGASAQILIQFDLHDHPTVPVSTYRSRDISAP